MLLGLLGSGEFEPWSAAVDHFLLERAGGGDGSVSILPTASAPEGDDVFDDWGRRGLEHYASLGIVAHVVPLRTHDDAMDPDMAKLISSSSMMFFSGGNPAHLSRVLTGTRFWDAVLERLEAGAALGGCSAGAVYLGEYAPDASGEDPTSPEALTVPGMRLLPGLMIGPHWDALDSFFPGLQQMFIDVAPEGSAILGIDENTAAVTEDGRAWGVVGAGGVHVYRDRRLESSFADGQTLTL